MTATDRIREQFRLWDSVDDRGQVLVAREDAEALCDLADAAGTLDAETRDLDPGVTYVRVDDLHAVRAALARLDREDQHA